MTSFHRVSGLVSVRRQRKLSGEVGKHASILISLSQYTMKSRCNGRLLRGCLHPENVGFKQVIGPFFLVCNIS